MPQFQIRIYTHVTGMRTPGLVSWQRPQAALHEQLDGGGGGRGHHEPQVRGVLVSRDVDQPLAPASLRPLRPGDRVLGRALESPVSSGYLYTPSSVWIWGLRDLELCAELIATAAT